MGREETINLPKIQDRAGALISSCPETFVPRSFVSTIGYRRSQGQRGRSDERMDRKALDMAADMQDGTQADKPASVYMPLGLADDTYCRRRCKHLLHRA